MNARVISEPGTDLAVETPLRGDLRAVKTAAKPRHSGASRRWFTPAGIAYLLVAVFLWWGYRLPTSQYITPQSGLGYALGIIGGSAMLLLLVYPARKRMPQLRWLGPNKLWFQVHMVLGVLGPALILYHSNFSLGAANSNVALVCMLVVSGSGLFGRYFYAHIHLGLHGRKATAADLRGYAERLRHVSTDVAFLPDLARRLEEEEDRLEATCARVPLLLRPLATAVLVPLARRRLMRDVRDAMQVTTVAITSPGKPRKLLREARRYIDQRLHATRRVVELAAFERLFSLWHALHMPLFVMLIVAGIVHVVAVHVY